jgi:hypothetical protein
VRPPEVAAVELRGSLAGRLRWHRALAHALVAAGPTAGAVFEASSESPRLVVTVRPESLLASVQTGRAADRAEALPVAVPGAPEPPLSGPGWIGVVRPGLDPNVRRGPLPEPPPLAPWVAAGAWFGVQCFWVPQAARGLLVAFRFRGTAADPTVRERAGHALAARVLADWVRWTGRSAEVARPAPFGLRDWRRGGVRSIPAWAWTSFAEGCQRLPEVGLEEFRPDPRPPGAHTVVFGASGAGKTTFLADEAARAVSEGRGVLVLDLHGDLAPQVLGRLPVELRDRVVAIDPGAGPTPGIAGLAAGDVPVDRAAAHFVAAVKRLSPDGSELAWGFRLERIFDTFARLVLETGGSLIDLYALLTDPDRRDAARLATRRAATARFLDELGPILRRDPEFLWSAATRLSKVVLVPALVELLAPSDGGLDVERLLGEGRVLLLRLPLATLGPESSVFAGTLVLGRAYLGLAARAGRSGRPVLLVLDEVQSFSPRMVAELLTESRKFGIEALAATQYPDRLAPEVRAAAAGAVGTTVTFRIPPASAALVGPWVALDPVDATRTLPGLPVGCGLVADPGGGAPRPLVTPGPTAPDTGAAWEAAVARTRAEFAVGATGEGPVMDEPPAERLLLAVLAGAEAGCPVTPSTVAAAAQRLPGEPIPPELLEAAWTSLRRGPEVEVTSTTVRLTAAGERRLGLGRSTGATRETAEHRALLLRAFRIFARHGCHLEILRQGRFDTTLPDALFRQLGREGSAGSPVEVARRIERARSGWAWRLFGGRDVHVEAEVSGALRPARVRHGWSKAVGRDAFVVFVVSDAHRAKRVRDTLRAIGVGPGRAQVWTLPFDARPPNG